VSIDRTSTLVGPTGATGATGATGPTGPSLTLTVVEQDLGFPPLLGGTFDITGLSGLTPNDDVLVVQLSGPYTGKGTLADESQEPIVANGYVVDSATIRVYWSAIISPIQGKVRFGYAVSA
jgi:hypothetical protein